MSIATTCLAFLQNIGMPELIVISIVALLIFGKRLPEVGRSVGKSIVEFKKGLREAGEEVSRDMPDENRPAPRSNASESRPVSAQFNDPRPAAGAAHPGSSDESH